jgi:hypothetical protein
MSGSILVTFKATLVTAAGRGMTAAMPYDAKHLELLEKVLIPLKSLITLDSLC